MADPYERGAADAAVRSQSLHSIPLVLVRNAWAAAVFANPKSALVIASMTAATTVGVVAQMLRQFSQDGKRGKRMPA